MEDILTAIMPVISIIVGTGIAMYLCIGIGLYAYWGKKTTLTGFNYLKLVLYMILIWPKIFLD